MPIQLDLIDFVKRQQRTDPPDAEPPAGAPSSASITASDPGFQSDVNRAVYSASIMRPIFELEARRLRQGDTDDTSAIWDGVDLFGLWVAIRKGDKKIEIDHTAYNLLEIAELHVEKTDGPVLA
ncbi:hypothetical protein [Desulfosarcina sp.]|uniref:hypothetical protein n=1 Tax=Desulfosarcina sp. TaxID=2027861 RepID=UPI0029A8F5F3|nr:hypothetical protein [Desulfosarcina sp.]MDX2452159.1 hypothetical protein [Desulfosarcina sp.]MDX2489952.1 hypothetical protein [Desulfosarcina sp.]